MRLFLRKHNSMSDLTDVGSGIAPVAPRENAADRPAGDNAGEATKAAKQTPTAHMTVDVAGDEAPREQLGDSLRLAKENISRLADDQKAAGAERIQGLARAVHGAASNLESELPQAAKPLHQAAAALERASTALKERSVSDLMNDVGKFARSQPVAFFGGTLLAGLVLARFLKSSTARGHDRS
jgi:hypothetical protein